MCGLMVQIYFPDGVGEATWFVGVWGHSPFRYTLTVNLTSTFLHFMPFLSHVRQKHARITVTGMESVWRVSVRVIFHIRRQTVIYVHPLLLALCRDTSHASFTSQICCNRIPAILMLTHSPPPKSNITPLITSFLRLSSFFHPHLAVLH